MKLRVPFYYDQFHCITSECKDNCCVGGWEIDIDDDTYNYYMSLDGELGDRIRESITKSEDGSNCFKLVDGHCGLLDKCGLCTIHKELGAEHLSVVCDQFPRYSEYYGEIKESGKHDELMSQNGAYRHLYESQMALENYGKGGVA